MSHHRVPFGLQFYKNHTLVTWVETLNLKVFSFEEVLLYKVTLRLVQKFFCELRYGDSNMKNPKIFLFFRKFWLSTFFTPLTDKILKQSERY